MNKQRLFILILSGAGILSTFLPWVYVPIFGSVSGAMGDGWITLILFLPSLIMSLIGEKQLQISGQKLIFSTVPAGIAGIIGLWKIIEFKSKMNGVSDNPYAMAVSASIGIGIGLYLVALSGILLPILAYTLKNK